MKYSDGSEIMEEDLVASYPRRIVKDLNYEIWQHPYVKDRVLHDDFDLQLIYFNDDKSIDSYVASDNSDHLVDINHLAKIQLIFHDICETFNEHTLLVEDILTDEASIIFEKIISEKINGNGN